MEKNVFIITAAGGNATAIQILKNAKERCYYSAQGRRLIDNYQAQGVEQSGFLISSQNHFEMSGGEFCGNASRAAAILLSQIEFREAVEFTMSGFKGLVRGRVEKLSDTAYIVSCNFPDMALMTKEIFLDQSAFIVDLGGIVHVVIEADFPKNFQEKHAEICEALNLQNREAVGVVWVKKEKAGVLINPVVWVKEIDSFFYESSCGSGSIAAAWVLKKTEIIQPTGQIIEVMINNLGVNLKSRMELINGKD